MMSEVVDDEMDPQLSRAVTAALTLVTEVK